MNTESIITDEQTYDLDWELVELVQRVHGHSHSEIAQAADEGLAIEPEGTPATTCAYQNGIHDAIACLPPEDQDRLATRLAGALGETLPPCTQERLDRAEGQQ